MADARIKVELDDGTGTWVTVVPLRHLTADSAIAASGEAFAMFMRSLCRDAAELDEHLSAVDDGRPTPMDLRRLAMAAESLG